MSRCGRSSGCTGPARARTGPGAPNSSAGHGATVETPSTPSLSWFSNVTRIDALKAGVVRHVRSEPAFGDRGVPDPASGPEWGVRKQYNFWPGETGLDAWDVDRLVLLSKDLPVREIALDSIDEIDTNYWFDYGPSIPPSAGWSNISGSFRTLICRTRSFSGAMEGSWTECIGLPVRFSTEMPR